MATDGLRAVVNMWAKLIHKGWEHRKREFSDDADEAMAFFDGPYNFLYSPYGRIARNFMGDEDIPAPTFRMTVNKVAELVQLFGPALYSRNPVRTISSRKFPVLPDAVVNQLLNLQADPFMAQVYMQMALRQDSEHSADLARAAVLEAYLNYTPLALDLKTESRQAIDEALIKGLGLLFTETYEPPGGGMRMIGSFFDTVDNLVVDPDAETFGQAKWIARRCIHPYWEVEDEYGLPRGSLKKQASLETITQAAAVDVTSSDYRRRQGTSNDLMVYWKVFSKMGAGGRITGIDPSLVEPLEPYGNFCYLVISESVPYPLNLPSPLADAMAGEDILLRQAATQEAAQRLAWPTPFWADDGWPFTPIYFHKAPRKLWPTSHVKPGLGELKFLNWAFSFLAGKVRVASRDFIAIAKSAGEELKDRIRHAGDYTIIEVEMIHESIDKVVKFLQHPGFNPEIYTVIEGVMQNFERRTGLSELLYGISAKQMRSAQEAQVKGDYASIRPDDMANKVEDAMSDVARKEALACRWHLQGQDVEPILGGLGAWWWQNLIVPSDPSRIVHQLEYRIEAGSARKPNKGLERDNMQSAVNTLFPTMWAYAQMTGDVGPVNAMISQWAKSIDLEGAPFLLKPPPPPQPPPGPGPAGASPGPPAPPPEGGEAT